MPRRSRIRSSSLENLAAQLRFAPRRTILRQIERAERLAGEVEPAGTYEEEWVAWKITGYRPTLTEPALLVGEALLGDLSAFVERLSEEAKLTPEEIGGAAPGGAAGGGREEGGTLTIDELCARWRVSRKTIERYRRRGLVGLRAHFGAGRVILVFRPAHIEAFEHAHAGRVRTAGAFARLSDRERARVARMGDRLARSQGLSCSAAAGRIAPRLGRGRETVRLILQRSARARSEPAGALSARQRLTIWRAHRWGVAPGAIALRFHRSRATIHRVINERRGELLRRLDLTPPHPPHAPDEFSDDSGAGAILAHAAVTMGLPAPGAMRGTAGEFVASFRKEPAMPAGRERALALGYRLLRFRAWRGVSALARRAPASRELDEIETMLRWASRVKVALVRGQCGLVLRSVEERIGSVERARDAAKWTRVALGAALAAVDGFDPLRGGGGGRLAAPTALALGRALAGAQARRAIESGGAARRADRSVSELADWTLGVSAWGVWLEAPRGMGEAAAELGDEAQAVIVARFGLGTTPPMTMTQARVRFGVSEAKQARMIGQALALARGLRARGRV